MADICPVTGHVVEDPDGPFCGDHGAKLFSHCSDGHEWSITWDPGMPYGEKGTDFCASCGRPAPWVSRPQLIQWIKGQLLQVELEPAKRHELQEVLDLIAQMDPDDTKTTPGWEKLRALAPQ